MEASDAMINAGEGEVDPLLPKVEEEFSSSDDIFEQEPTDLAKENKKRVKKKVLTHCINAFLVVFYVSTLLLILFLLFRELFVVIVRYTIGWNVWLGSLPNWGSLTVEWENHLSSWSSKNNFTFTVTPQSLMDDSTIQFLDSQSYNLSVFKEIRDEAFTCETLSNYAATSYVEMIGKEFFSLFSPIDPLSVGTVIYRVFSVVFFPATFSLMNILHFFGDFHASNCDFYYKHSPEILNIVPDANLPNITKTTMMHDESSWQTNQDFSHRSVYFGYGNLTFGNETTFKLSFYSQSGEIGSSSYDIPTIAETGLINGNKIPVTRGRCDELRGFWDDNYGVCFLKWKLNSVCVLYDPFENELTNREHAANEGQGCFTVYHDILSCVTRGNIFSDLCTSVAIGRRNGKQFPSGSFPESFYDLVPFNSSNSTSSIFISLKNLYDPALSKNYYSIYKPGYHGPIDRTFVRIPDVHGHFVGGDWEEDHKQFRGYCGPLGSDIPAEAISFSWNCLFNVFYPKFLPLYLDNIGNAVYFIVFLVLVVYFVLLFSCCCFQCCSTCNRVSILSKVLTFAPDDWMRILQGKKNKDFTRVREISKRPQGSVWQVKITNFPVSMDRSFAMKIVHDHSSSSGDENKGINSFLNTNVRPEFITRLTKHPNLLRYYYWFTDFAEVEINKEVVRSKCAFYVMDLCDGTLADLIQVKETHQEEEIPEVQSMQVEEEIPVVESEDEEEIPEVPSQQNEEGERDVAEGEEERDGEEVSEEKVETVVNEAEEQPIIAKAPEEKSTTTLMMKGFNTKKEFLCFLRDIVNGLIKLDKSCLIHCDIKPSNIFFKRMDHQRKRFIIGDFGACFDYMQHGKIEFPTCGFQPKFVNPKRKGIRGVFPQGSWNYMPSEIKSGVKKLDYDKYASFSLGVICFQVFTPLLPNEIKELADRGRLEMGHEECEDVKIRNLCNKMVKPYDSRITLKKLKKRIDNFF